ncbi:MAG: Tungsten-containing aldehyde:ferredoxin oxidoreductase [Firmicutes bacterium]|nr:Tungsten-containing aldehyde:ferredoxin oxidoreductase [Bacillota bacterium]
MFGYQKRILSIDLTERKADYVEYGEDIMRKYLGGTGLAAYIFADMVDPKLDPFDENNIIIVATGPLCGTPVPAASKMVIAGKSPATHGFFYSVSGGRFGVELKQAGFDAIILRGKSDQPVWIDIDNSDVKFIPAYDLWGLNTFDTQRELIRGKRKAETMVIGPAGENKVKFAGIMTGSRCAARGGLGAVIGSKNLKGIRVYGTNKVKVPDTAQLSKWVSHVNKCIKDNIVLGTSMPTYGTPGTLMNLNKLGILGTRNWQSEWFELGEQLSGQKLREEYNLHHTACFACPISCSHVNQVRGGSLNGIKSEGPDYETLYALGSMCGISDLSTIIAADKLCDEYGLDTISTGVTIAFAMECAEKGYMETGYADSGLRFGNNEALLKLIPLIALKEGIGAELSMGTRELAKHIGHNSETFAANVRGLEIAGHSPRGCYMMGLGYSTSPRGGSHLDSRPTIEYKGLTAIDDITDKAELVAETQIMTAVGDSMILCRFTEHLFGHTLKWNLQNGGEDMYATSINLVTGWDIDIEELEMIGRRIWCLERMYNLASGFKNEKDTLPSRFLDERISTGPSTGRGITKEILDQMLANYYKYVGWDNNGVPTVDTLKKLDLDRF